MKLISSKSRRWSSEKTLMWHADSFSDCTIICRGNLCKSQCGHSWSRSSSRTDNGKQTARRNLLQLEQENNAFLRKVGEHVQGHPITYINSLHICLIKFPRYHTFQGRSPTSKETWTSKYTVKNGGYKLTDYRHRWRRWFWWWWRHWWLWRWWSWWWWWWWWRRRYWWCRIIETSWPPAKKKQVLAAAEHNTGISTTGYAKGTSTNFSQIWKPHQTVT